MKRTLSFEVEVTGELEEAALSALVEAARTALIRALLQPMGGQSSRLALVGDATATVAGGKPAKSA